MHQRRIKLKSTIEVVNAKKNVRNHFASHRRVVATNIITVVSMGSLLASPRSVSLAGPIRRRKIGANQAARRCCSSAAIDGYRRSTCDRNWSLSTAIRICGRLCARRGRQAICCRLTKRLLTTWLTADSTKPCNVLPMPTAVTVVHDEVPVAVQADDDTSSLTGRPQRPNSTPGLSNQRNAG